MDPITMAVMAAVGAASNFLFQVHTNEVQHEREDTAIQRRATVI